MIRNHLDAVLCPGQIGPPFFERRNDSEKLLVIYGVVDFWGSELARVVSHRVKHTNLIWLGEDSPNGEVRSICFDVERLSWVWVKKDWC